jgi:hypothetical protein
MTRDSEIKGFWAQRIAVGLSSLIEVTGIPYQVLGVLKYQALGGTLEIVGTTGILQGVSYGVQNWGAGFVLDVGDELTFDGTAKFYLRSAGATSVVHVLYGLGAGYDR